MPVGEVAPGCPLKLDPACGLARMGETFNAGACEHRVEWNLAAVPGAIPYVDVVVGDPLQGNGRLLRVRDEAACGSTGNGWYFDDPAHPTTIRVCRNACECVTRSGGRFSMELGCWTHAAAGVLDAEIPCPRCAKERAKTCVRPTGGWGIAMHDCEAPVSGYGEVGFAFPPDQINVVYEQHGATAGRSEPWDGYLTYVPSLAQCDEVEEGWTIDTTAVPPMIRICPSACSCARIHGASLMVEGGCPRHQSASTPARQVSLPPPSDGGPFPVCSSSLALDNGTCAKCLGSRCCSVFTRCAKSAECLDCLGGAGTRGCDQVPLYVETMGCHRAECERDCPLH